MNGVYMRSFWIIGKSIELMKLSRHEGKIMRIRACALGVLGVTVS